MVDTKDMGSNLGEVLKTRDAKEIIQNVLAYIEVNVKGGIANATEADYRVAVDATIEAPAIREMVWSGINTAMGFYGGFPE